MAQALHGLLWHHGPQRYEDRVYSWRECADPYCDGLRTVLLAPRPEAEILEPRRIESPWHGDDDEPWHVTVKES